MRTKVLIFMETWYRRQTHLKRDSPCPDLESGLQSRKEETALRRYETILIAHVDLSEDELSSLITRYSTIITGQKGILVKVERWGKRRLAYIIKKQARGFYILIDYAGETAAVNELERNLKINDKILKFMTVLRDDAVDPAALEQEIAEAAQKTEKKEEVKVTAPATPLAAAPVESPAPTAAEIQQPAPEETKTDVKGDN
jgi:small subunit ribosomal protein S6